MDKSQLEAQSNNLSNLISYQQSAVVSRTIIDKNVGTVTLFAFDQKQGLSEHTAPFDAMVIILEGAATVTIAGKPITLKEGETTIMPANKPHALTAVTPFKMLLIMIKA